MLNNKVRVSILVLFLILEEMFSFFTIEDNVCCQFVIYGLCYVEVCSFYASFLESFFFIINGFVFCQKLCIYWDDHMVFLSNC